MKRRALLGQLGAGIVVCSVCTSLGLLRAKADEHGAVHWGYSGDYGPEHWGSLAPDFSTCGLGKLQSPIDINGPVEAELGALKVDYHATALRILNNGHTVQVNYDPGSTLQVRNRSYQIAQFHFHTPSEHTVDGKRYDMELHIVHQDDAKNLAVVGVFLKAGASNAALANIWAELPLVATPEKTVAGVSVNVADLLPAKRAYYQYLGSLTTPPCTENVLWLVLAQPVEISQDQVAKFGQAFSNDTRPVQALNQRFVYEEAF